MPRAKKATYRVRNPRRIRAGVPVIRIDRQVWYEGDEFTPPSNLSQETLDNLLEGGFLETVDG